MKTFILAGAMLVIAGPAFAQIAAPAPTLAPATTSLTLDSAIESLIADPGAKVVVLTTLPNIESEPGYDQFKVVSLRRLQPHSGGKITEENITAIEAGLKALSTK